MSAARRYRVLGVLGRGGFGTVYKAEQLGEGMEQVRSVAARLRDEARMLARIRHRAIVPRRKSGGGAEVVMVVALVIGGVAVSFVAMFLLYMLSNMFVVVMGLGYHGYGGY